jgi:hypothetical protein
VLIHTGGETEWARTAAREPEAVVPSFLDAARALVAAI